MKKGIIGLVGAAAFITLYCFCGDSSTNAPVEAVTTTPISSLKLDTLAFPGWSQSDFMSDPSDSLNLAVNGEMVKLNNNGAKYFSQQVLNNGDHQAKLLVIDFATIQAAKKNFSDYYTTNQANATALGANSLATVFVTKTDFYYSVFAQINKYYIKMDVSINGDNTFADAAAKAFYNKYVSLVK